MIHSKMIQKEIIDSYIIKFFDNSISDEEAKILHHWLQNDENNLQYFNQIKKIWDSCIELNSSQEELENALVRFRKNFNTHPLIKKPTYISWFSRIAAVLISGIAIFGLYHLFLNDHSNQPPIVYCNSKIIIPKGQKGQLILSDSTKVWLNSESTLEYPGVFELERKVVLNGEAYFEVKSDEKHPFIVQTPKLKIKVTGTIFNIKSYSTDDETETTLVEGRLSILNNDHELVVLQPNESATYSRKKNDLKITNLASKTLQSITEKEINRTSTKEISPVELITIWKEDKLIFQDEPLGNMIPKLERWFNRKIHVTNPELLLNEFSGKFVYNETIYQVLDIICRSSDDINYKEKDHEFYISKK